MTGPSTIKDVLLLTLETLAVLGDILRDPARSSAYCQRAGFPPLDVETDWLPRVVTLRSELEDGDVADAMAQVIVILERVRGAVNVARAVGLAAYPEVLVRLALPCLIFAAQQRRDRRSWVIVYTVLMALVIVDERLQEGLSNPFAFERWATFVASALKRGDVGDDAAWSGVLAAGLGVVGFAARFFLDPKPSMYVHGGFDHPGVLGLEEPLDSARHSAGIFFGRPRAIGEGGYIEFDPPRSPWHHREVAFAFVPLIRHDESTVPGAPAAHGGGLYVQGNGSMRWDIGETMLPGWTGELTVNADGGALFPLGGEPKVHLAGIGSLSADATLTYTRPDIDDQTGALALPDSVDDEDDPIGVSIRLRRSTTVARLAADPYPTFQFDHRFDGVELRIGALPVLKWLLPAGLRIAFDAGVHFDADRRELRIIGSIGGELVVPLDLTIPLGIGKVRARAIHARLATGGDAQVPSSEEAEPGRLGGIRAEIVADLSVTLLDILTVHADRVGFVFTAGSTDDGRGNLAGVANIGWETKWPTGVGIEVRAWKIRGGGYLLYDAPTGRLGGGVALRIGSLFELKGVGLCEPTPDGRGRSWIAVGALENPRPGGLFTWKGIGGLYASNRRSDPQAFLDGLGSGDLDAVLFPSDPVGNAAAYVGALGRLFPAADSGEVFGAIGKVGAFGSQLTIALGLIIDRGGGKTYLVGQVRAVTPRDDLAVVRIEADGVAVWDAARDEFQMRIVLRNSRVWGGELTGEALVFKGDPDRTDGLDQTCTIFSAGGFHPAYNLPGAALRVPPRLALTVARGDHLQIEVKLYVAWTPSTLHLGLEGLLQARFAGFGIRGRLGFDALIGKDELNVSLRASVELQLGSRTLAGATLEGSLVGYGPTLFTGRACIKFLFWEVCSPPFCVDLEWGDNRLPPSPDVDTALQAAVEEARNWDSGGASGLTLRDVARDGVWLSPSAPLRFTQTLVPLGRVIVRYEGTRLATAMTFELSVALPAGWQSSPLNAEFAPALYFDLTTEQKLAAQALEALPAGVQLERPYETGTALEVGFEYDQILVDRTWPVPPPRETVIMPDQVIAAGMSLSPGRVDAYYQRPIRPLRMHAERFAVIDDELAIIDGDLDFAAAHGATLGSPGRMIAPMAEVA
jgi:hypothetical protein